MLVTNSLTLREPGICALGEKRDIAMERQIAPLVQWREVVQLSSTARECRACCLEPNETLVLTLTADDPIDAALVDWDAYEAWCADGGADMPAGSHFANDTRSVQWRSCAAEAPFIAVLVVANPGKRNTCIRIEASVQTVPDYQATDNSTSEHRSAGQVRRNRD